jgi:hypothetical protein
MISDMNRVQFLANSVFGIGAAGGLRIPLNRHLLANLRSVRRSLLQRSACVEL